MKENKTGRKPLLVGIIAAVVILAVLLALVLAQCVGGQQGETTAPSTAANQEEETYVLYWNLDRALYDGKSEAGLSSRMPEDDGYFHVRFFCEGETLTLKVADRKIINAIDVQDLMGLEFDENGIVIAMTRLDEMSLEKVAWKFYVQSAARTLIKANSSQTFNGMEVLLEDLDPQRVWDMSGISGEVGCVSEAIKYDQIMAIANDFGEITHVYIFNRPNYMRTHEAHCQHCNAVVSWSEWTQTDALPVDGGHYQLQNDVKPKGQTNTVEDAKICLDLNGYRIDGKQNGRIISMHNVGAELAIMDTSEAQTGVIAPHGNDNQGQCVWVRYGAFYLYSGTLDASDATGTDGTAVSVSKNSFFYMHGGKIVGGTAMWRQNEETGKFSAGTGGALAVSGKFVMNDGIIENGRAVSAVTYADGSPNFNRGLGGNIFLGSSASFEMNGGIIRGGSADSYGGNIAADGTAEIIINGGTIQGGYVGGETRMGGNIYMSSKVTLTLNGGSIVGGTTRGHSGNIYCSGTMIMNGGYIGGGRLLDPKTGKENPEASNRNIFLVNGTLNMWGGTIQGGVSVTDTSATDTRTATVYLNGVPQITDTSKNSDLNIANNRVVVNVGTLYKGAKIGVRTTVGIFTKPTKAENADMFYSNIQGADILFHEDCLALGRLGCICGKQEHALGCDGKELLWVPYTAGNTLPTTTGNYFLIQDVTSTKQHVVGMGQNVKLDLNGFDVTFRVPTSLTGGFLLYRADYDGKLAITDTTGQPGTLRTEIPAAGTKYTGSKLLKEEVDGEKIYFEKGSAEEQAEAERLWAAGDFGTLLWVRGGEITIHNGIFDGSNLSGTRSEGGMVVNVGNVTSTDKETGKKTTFNGTLNIYDGIIKGGKTTAAGNISVNAGTTMNIYGGTIEGGTANGGAVRVSGTVNMYGGTVTGGLSQNAEGERTDGGNFYVSGGKLNIQGGTVTGGKGNTGGNIYAGTGSVTVTGGIIEKGEAIDAGGNIGTNSGGSAITVGGTAIIREGTAKRGGNLALFVRGNKAFTVEGEAQILNGSATTSGGNIDVNTWLNNPSDFQLKGGTVSGGTAPKGGNIHVTGGNANFTATGGIITGGIGANGANIAIYNGQANVTLGGVTIHNTKENSASILVEAGKLTIAEGTKLTNEAAGATNVATNGTTNAVAAILMSGGEISGGKKSNVILESGDSFLMTDGIVSGGAAVDGGNFNIGTGATLEIQGGIVTGGRSGDTGSGGNIYVGAGKLLLTGGTIEKGWADKGGNICTASKDSDITIGGAAEVKDGQAKSRGGNICVNMRGGKSFTIGGEAAITGGTAGSEGGNICVYIDRKDKSASITMTGGTVSGGAAVKGDNIFVRGHKGGTDLATGTFLLEGGTVGTGSGDSSIYLNDAYSYLTVGDAIVQGGINAEKGNVTLKGAPTIEKTDGGYGYSLKLAKGSVIDAKEMTGGKVLVHLEPAEGKFGVTVEANGEAVLAALKGENTEAPIVLSGGTDLYFARKYCLCGASKTETTHATWCDGDHYWIPWDGKTNLATDGYYYVAKAGSIASTAVSANVVLDLNGLTISSTGRAFNIDTGASLGITDTEGNGTIQGGKADTGASLRIYGTATLYAGTIQGGISENADGRADGGNIAVKTTDAAFIMLGGKVTGGKGNTGGNIFAAGTVTITGGIIEKGEASNCGGNIGTNSSNSNITVGGDAIIQDGAAVLGGNLGIYVRGNKSFVVEGNAQILNGSATTSGGNIDVNTWLNNPSNFQLKGGTVSGGTAPKGGNIHVTGNNGNFTATGGTIEAGESTNGANLAIYNAKANVTLGNVSISNTQADAKSILVEAGKLNIGEGTAITNEAAGATNVATTDTEGASANITMFGGTISGGTNSNVIVSKGDSFTLSGGTIQGGKAKNGGNVNVHSEGTFTMEAGTISGGKLLALEGNTFGGNVYISGTFIMKNGTVEGGEATDGGNFFVNSSASLTIEGGMVSKGLAGTAGTGGNVALNGRANLTVSGGTIKEGTAQKGGNIGSGATAARITIMGNAQILDGYATQKGGNIGLHQRGSELTIQGNAQITGGRADSYGGNICAQINSLKGAAGTVTVLGGQISGGSAPKGENVYLEGYDATYAVTFTMSGGTVGTGMDATKSSIHLNNAYTKLELAGGTVAGCINAEKGAITLKNAPVVDKTGSSYGYSLRIGKDTIINAEYMTGGKVFVTKEPAEGKFAVTVAANSEAVLAAIQGENTDIPVVLAGNALHFARAYCLCGASKTETAHAAWCDGNHFWTPWDGTTNLATDGYYYLSGTNENAKVTVSANVVLDLNGLTISSASRAFNIDTGASLGITDTEGNGTIQGGKADTGASLRIYGTATLYAGTIQGGISENADGRADGGNIAVKTTGAAFIMLGGKVTGGKGNTGGNIFAAGTVTITGGIIEKGEASNCGGNIGTNSSNSNITVGGDAIIQDGTAVLGGNLGIYVRGNKSFVVEGNAQILNGSATTSGGNIDVNTWRDNASNFQLKGGTVSGGSAPIGGNVHVTGNNGNFTATGGTIEAGESTNGANLAIYNAKANVTLGNVSISNTQENSTSILVEAGTLNIGEGTAITNEAAGATNVATTDTEGASANITMFGGTISGGTNSNVIVSKGDSFTLSGGAIQGGKAKNGGNVNVHSEGTFTMEAGTISGGKLLALEGNTFGGNVYISGTFIMKNGTVEGGEATDGGNFFVNSNASLTIEGGMVSKGLAGTAGTGGNVALNGRANLTVSGGIIKEGTAQKGGNIGSGATASKITISGDAQILDGHATQKGGNIGLHQRGSELIIQGNAQITGGSADSYGGNICAQINSLRGAAGTVTMLGGQISGGSAPEGENVYLQGFDATYAVTFTMSGGTVGAGKDATKSSIYLNNACSYLTVGNATVQGGINAEKGNVTLKGAPTIDKTGTDYTYSIKLGNAMDVAGLTGGKIFVTAPILSQVGSNATSGMEAFVLSEVELDGQVVPVEFSGENTLTLGSRNSVYCLCGASRASAYACQCAEGEEGDRLWQAWTGKNSLPTASGNYYLTDDVDITAETVAKPAAGATICIDLRGKTIKLESDENLYDFAAVTGVQLVITDSTTTAGAVTITGKATITGGIMSLTEGNHFALYRATLDATGLDASAKGGSIAYVNPGASFTMYSGSALGKTGSMIFVDGEAQLLGGTVTGASIKVRMNNKDAKVKLSGVTITNAVANATSVRIDKGQLTIEAGTTISNTAAGATNIITISDGSSEIIMTGGTISGGKNSNVILEKDDTFEMSGGIITGGEAVDGGNIKINSGAAVTISGGTVTGGRSGDTGSGGNILVGAGTLTVTGGTIEKGWADKGGNIATMSSSSSITIGGKAEIKDGQAKSRGGNICINMRGGKSFTIGGEATITGGTAASQGGNICIYVDRKDKSASITMTGGTVSGGSATMGDNIFVRGFKKNSDLATGTFLLEGGTIGAGGEDSCGNSIYLNDAYSYLTVGDAIVQGGLNAEKGNVTLKGAPTIDKTGTDYTYGIKLGNAMDVAGLTGGKVYVTATTGKVIAEKAAKDLTANILSEVAAAKVTYNATAKTLSYEAK